MGHYRSESGYDDEDEKKAKQKAQTREATAEYIRKVAEEKGLMYVLADIVLDPQMAKFKYQQFE
jgi:hypothetical protein